MKSNFESTQFFEKFSDTGLFQFQFTEKQYLDSLKSSLVFFTTKYFSKSITSLDNAHTVINSKNINEFRQEAIKYINSDSDFRIFLDKFIIQHFSNILGPDLVIQKNLNLVISIPHDNTSQIPLHCDTLTGNSPHELTLWLPLTNVSKSQSMFMLSLNKWKEDIGTFSKYTISELMEKWGNDIKFIKMNYGEAAIFWHAIPHGNIVNTETTTRWAINVRFKNLFSPYGERKLVDYFRPLQISSFTKMALEMDLHE